jgi:methyl-accepting chemotaxis protein
MNLTGSSINITLDYVTYIFIGTTVIIGLIYFFKYLPRFNKAKRDLSGFDINNMNTGAGSKVSSLVQLYLASFEDKGKTSEYACDTINIDSISEEYQIKLPVLATIPNILTSIGILGTFVGLAIAIKNFDSQSSEAIRDSIQILLGGMGTAFFTSVAGMLCSSIFLMIERHWINDLNWKIDSLCAQLDEEYHASVDQLIINALSYTTDDGYVVEPYELLHSVKDSVTDMQTTLSRFGTDLCDSIGNAMDNSFQEKLVPIINELSQKLENPAQAITDSLVTEFKNICNDFSANLTKGVNDQMNELMERFIDASNSINTLPETISAISDELKESTSNTANAHKALSASINKYVSQFNDLTGTLSGAINKLQGVIFNIGDLHENLNYIPQAVTEARKAIDSASSNLLVAVDGITGSIDNANATNEATRQKVDEYINNITQIQTGLKEVFSEISDGLTQYSATAKAGLQQMLDPFTTSVAEASEQVANSIAPLNDAVSDLGDFGESIHKALEDLNNTLKPLEKAIANLNKYRISLEKN